MLFMEKTENSFIAKRHQAWSIKNIVHNFSFSLFLCHPFLWYSSRERVRRTAQKIKCKRKTWRKRLSFILAIWKSRAVGDFGSIFLCVKKASREGLPRHERLRRRKNVQFVHKLWGEEGCTHFLCCCASHFGEEKKKLIIKSAVGEWEMNWRWWLDYGGWGSIAFNPILLQLNFKREIRERKNRERKNREKCMMKLKIYIKRGRAAGYMDACWIFLILDAVSSIGAEKI